MDMLKFFGYRPGVKNHYPLTSALTHTASLFQLWNMLTGATQLT